MNQALYRKYRSKSFKEVVGQEHITQTLERAIKSGRISHAYLFTGPRGVGKTSVARILAHEVNQLPYKSESIHLDIIEIDAASNRRIDEIRDLRERVRIAPTTAKYKVYIIDEVHMLTREAFNALLKTLEEPPAHCIFILATTEAHKLPETIISRTQRFEFKPINPEQAAKHLAAIAKKERIDISSEALQLLAEFGSGSFRDSIGYLDQLSGAGQPISDADVRQFLGLPKEQEVTRLIEAIGSADPPRIVTTLQQIKEQGVGAPELANALAQQLRRRLIDNSGQGFETQLLKELIEVKANIRPYDYLEISLLEAATKSAPSDGTDSSSGNAAAKSSSLIQKRPQNNIASFNLDNWEELVTAAKDQAASIYTALRLAQPSWDDGVLTLSFRFPLHQKKLEQASNKAMVASLIEKIFGVKLQIKCVVDKTLQAESPSETMGPPDNSLHSITNIFGAAEMLES